jgi:hypothetical protein
MKLMIEHLATGFSNAMNFTRANRLVLVSDLTSYQAFARSLVEATRAKMLGELAGRVKFDLWNQPAARSAETAGWLALASLYYEGWNERRVERTVPAAAMQEEAEAEKA